MLSVLNGQRLMASGWCFFLLLALCSPLTHAFSLSPTAPHQLLSSTISARTPHFPNPLPLVQRPRASRISDPQPLIGLKAQLDPATLASTVPPMLELLSSSAPQPITYLAFDPVEDIKEYVFGHPLQDFVGLLILTSTINFLRAGASLPVAIVAGCLEFLRNIPGFALIGQKPILKLVISLLIDGIGIASYLLPFVGEVGDAGWAPASAILVKALYGSNALAGFDFFEELIPGTDFIPTATIGFALEYVPGLRQMGLVKGLYSGPNK